MDGLRAKPSVEGLKVAALSSRAFALLCAVVICVMQNPPPPCPDCRIRHGGSVLTCVLLLPGNYIAAPFLRYHRNPRETLHSGLMCGCERAVRRPPLTEHIVQTTAHAAAARTGKGRRYGPSHPLRKRISRCTSCCCLHACYAMPGTATAHADSVTDSIPGADMTHAR
eukprot:2549431-Rhodomonas_salina.4